MAALQIGVDLEKYGDYADILFSVEDAERDALRNDSF